jgi:hypothetical protein
VSHLLGALLASTEDGQGTICVHQLGQHRFLTFGNAVEQSCYNIAQPHRLEHVYTQAMMLGPLLHAAPASALILGLGGGSLVRALRRVLPGIHITAVESRAAVIDLARQWFGLDEDDALLELVCEDAAGFLQQGVAQFDLIFADLYLAEGVNPLQNTRDFLDACRAHLGERGILLLNHWCSEFRDSQQSRQALREVFGEQTLELQVQGGNVITFAFRGSLPGLRKKPFLEAALTHGQRLDIPLQRLARNFWRQNSEALGVGRFRRRNAALSATR